MNLIGTQMFRPLWNHRGRHLGQETKGAHLRGAADASRSRDLCGKEQQTDRWSEGTGVPAERPGESQPGHRQRGEAFAPC